MFSFGSLTVRKRGERMQRGEGRGTGDYYITGKEYYLSMKLKPLFANQDGVGKQIRIPKLISMQIISTDDVIQHVRNRYDLHLSIKLILSLGV